MVNINLISLVDGIATVKCLPEGKVSEQFILVLDVINQNILKNSSDINNSHVIHAAWKIYDVYKETGTLPNSISAIWC